jgi:hypothetical protein
VHVNTLQAVHDDDLDELLERLGVAHDFRAGSTRCKFCGDVVNDSNLNALFPESGAVKFACTKPECVIALATHRGSPR